MARRSRGELARLRREIEQLRAQADEVTAPPIRVRLGFDPSGLVENVRRRREGEPVGLRQNGQPLDAPLPAVVVEVEEPAQTPHAAESAPGPKPKPVPVPAWVQRPSAPPHVWRSQASRGHEAIAGGLLDVEF